MSHTSDRVPASLILILHFCFFPAGKYLIMMMLIAKQGSLNEFHMSKA